MPFCLTRQFIRSKKIIKRLYYRTAFPNGAERRQLVCFCSSKVSVGGLYSGPDSSRRNPITYQFTQQYNCVKRPALATTPSA